MLCTHYAHPKTKLPSKKKNKHVQKGVGCLGKNKHVQKGVVEPKKNNSSKRPPPADTKNGWYHMSNAHYGHRTSIAAPSVIRMRAFRIPARSKRKALRSVASSALHKSNKTKMRKLGERNFFNSSLADGFAGHAYLRVRAPPCLRALQKIEKACPEKLLSSDWQTSAKTRTARCSTLSAQRAPLTDEQPKSQAHPTHHRAHNKPPQEMSALRGALLRATLYTWKETLF